MFESACCVLYLFVYLLIQNPGLTTGCSPCSIFSICILLCRCYVMFRKVECVGGASLISEPC